MRLDAKQIAGLLILTSTVPQAPGVGVLVQRFPPGGQVVMDITGFVNLGTIMASGGVINRAAFDFTGDPANTTQTAHLRILLNGVSVYDGPALPTTAGEHQSLSPPLGIEYNALDKITLQLVLSAALAAALTSLTTSISS